ncbi:hypothetical protein FALCPG4_012902 [Fusarium falciforme]
MARPKLQLVFTDVDDRYEPMSLLGTRLYENRVSIDGLVNPHPELTSPIAMSRINAAVRHNAHDGWPAGNFDKKLVIEGGKLNAEDAESGHE